MRNFLAASLLATEAFLAASNLSCLLLSNKSILNLLVFMILHFLCKEYASERNESLLSNCRAQLILCKDTRSFRKMQEIYGKMFESEEDKTTLPTLGTVSNQRWAITFSAKVLRIMCFLSINHCLLVSLQKQH